MRKFLTLFSASLLMLSLCACGKSAAESGSSLKQNLTDKDVTVEYLVKASTPGELLKDGAFACETAYEGIDDTPVIRTTYSMKGDIFELNDIVTNYDGSVTNSFFSSDPDDLFYYMIDNGEAFVDPVEPGYSDLFINASILGYAADDTEIREVKNEGSCITAAVSFADPDFENLPDIVTLDKASGRILRVEIPLSGAYSEDTIDSTLADDDNADSAVCVLTFDYSEKAVIDYSARLAGRDLAAKLAEANRLNLNTEDLNGNPVNNELVKDAKLVLVNLWEPWCGPCVGEMPDLQKLYKKYQSKGLVIVGAYQSREMQSEAEDIVAKNGITYPIVKTNEYLDALEQEYVPATFLFDGEGYMLTNEPIAGAQSYEDWETLIKSYLSK